MHTQNTPQGQIVKKSQINVTKMQEEDETVTSN